jgi:hypothetical protein
MGKFCLLAGDIAMNNELRKNQQEKEKKNIKFQYIKNSKTRSNSKSGFIFSV